jgi:C1A family cysteine protease
VGEGSRLSIVDLRSTLTAVRDQGNRGTCLAFGLTAVHEQARGAIGDDNLLCVEKLYHDAIKRLIVPATPHRPGLTLPAASGALSDHGQGNEKDWPYDGDRDAFVPEYVPPAEALTHLRCSTTRKVELTPTAVRSELDAGRAVVMGIKLWDGFIRADSNTDTVTAPATSDLMPFGHAVVVVGHDDAGRLLVRNSWGDVWGTAGHAWIDETFVADAGMFAAVIDHMDAVAA